MKISENQKYIDVTGRTQFIAGRRKVRNGAFWVYYGYQVDRQGNQISDLGMWKSDGKDWAGDMRNNLLREASVGMKLGEGQAIILERLIEAVETDKAMPGNVGPKKYGNGMPATGFDDIDIMLLEMDEEWKGQSHHTKHRSQDAFMTAERRTKCSPQRISRMEQAFSWLGAYVFDHEMRVLIMAYVTCKANGMDWRDVISRRNKKHSEKKSWVRATTYRHIERILQDVEIKLLKDAIILRDCAGLPLRQDEAKQLHKQITSCLCASSSGDLSREVDPMLATASAA